MNLIENKYMKYCCICVFYEFLIMVIFYYIKKYVMIVYGGKVKG